jgi:hypothetical protein
MGCRLGQTGERRRARRVPPSPGSPALSKSESHKFSFRLPSSVAMGGSSSALFRPLLEAELHVEKVYYERLDPKLPKKEQRRIVDERYFGPPLHDLFSDKYERICLINFFRPFHTKPNSAAKVSLLRDIDDCEGDRRAAMSILRAQSDALLRPIFEHFDSKRRGVLDREQFTLLVHAALIALRTELLALLRAFLARKYQTIKYLHRMRCV